MKCNAAHPVPLRCNATHPAIYSAVQCSTVQSSVGSTVLTGNRKYYATGAFSWSRGLIVRPRKPQNTLQYTTLHYNIL